ncbi:FtsX family ABC transporter permease [Polaromonas sp.]|uniref:ABC transporter permease n=1 Tax=Polaromonas sp. TaxID=1869339 RepID=UPI002731B375|nr:FtsX family ABC transporter permease [Polaromonas sp.]MDP2452324.1 ABC transporter permease [Polaromonas sp.]
MKALDRKLLRDLRLLWSQGLTIALVVASGIGGFITSLSAVDSLGLARERFYAEAHFADVFATVKRAPNALVETLREVPGVADVQTTIEQVVRIAAPGVSDPILGQLVGVDRKQLPRMNQVSVSRGRALDNAGLASGARSDGRIEVLVSAGFATSRGVKPGDIFTALINGKQRTLRIAGIALSPEYIFAGLGGSPDQRGFGVFWMDRDTLAAAYDMQGAFNRVSIKLAPGASQRDVIARMSRLLARYGAGEAYGREDQISHAMLDAEIKEQQVLGTVLPSIFLGVAAFLLHVVVSRLVSTQREQIAALKALGYTNRSIGAHYLKMVLVIVILGLLLGIWLGDWLGGAFTRLYADFFYFPTFEHHLAPWLLVVGAGLTLATAVLGTLSAIGATVRLAPAEAMRPPAPGHFRRTLLERLGVKGVKPALQMILRNMERRPLRTGLSIAGVAAAVAIVVMGNFIRDAIDHIVDTQFTLAMRSDVILWMSDPIGNEARHEVARMPGVIAVEATRDVPVRFVNGPVSERGLIQGYAENPALRRIVDIRGREVPLPDGGLVMTDRLASKLGLRVGDTVRTEVLEGRRETLQLTLAATAQEMMGLNAYMERRALNRLMREGDVASQYAVALQRGSEAAFLAASQGLPRVAGTFSKANLLRNMQEVSARNVRLMSLVLTVFASVIAVGVVYNNARIALSERTWELASLRVLGFTRAEVSVLLLGELAISIAIALPLGMLMGWGLVHLVAELLKSDQFQFPVVIQPRTYAWAAICVVAAGVASALVVRRRIDRLDMVAALKTRE